MDIQVDSRSVQHLSGVVEHIAQTCVVELAKPQLCSFMSPEIHVDASEAMEVHAL